MTRHAHEDALTEQEFEQLLDGAKQLPPPLNLETMFVILLTGRLGLRIGELAHIKRSWVNFETGLVSIPSVEPCTKGRDGGLCGYCRRQTRRIADREASVDLEALRTEYWQPKTAAAERAVPFEFSARVANIIAAFFEAFVEWPYSVHTARRRVSIAAAVASLAQRIYPHCLRATAASAHAYRGLTVPALQAMMGWAQIDTAEKYIRLSGGRTKAALDEVYG
jgi:integrase